MGTTYRMFPFITPPIWRSLVSIALYSTPTASPQRLIECTLAFGIDTLDFGALIVVRNETASVAVLDFKEPFMTPDTVKTRGRNKLGKERGQEGDDLGRRGVWRQQLSEGVCVECLWRDGLDQGPEIGRILVCKGVRRR